MNYTRTYLKSRVNAAIKNKIGVLTNADDTCNQAVREAFGEINFRSAKRRLQLPTGLFSDIFSYPCPVDINGASIVDIFPVDNSKRTTDELILRIPEEFWRKQYGWQCAIDDSDTYKKLLVSIPVTDSTFTISTLDDTTDGLGGTWSAFDVSTTNVETNNDDYIKGSGSISFDINAVSGTTAGIKNAALDAFDYSDFLSGFVFSYVEIVDPTNITNFKLRIGNSASIYYELTATTTHEGTAFETGWNLIRFNMSSKVAVGSPTTTAGTYAALYMTKSTSKVSEVGYKFDQLILKKGPMYTLSYYTQYGWISSSGTYKLESTLDSDYLLCNADEFDIILAKTVSIAAQECAEDGISATMDKKYMAKKASYEIENPDESLLLQTQYYDF